MSEFIITTSPILHKALLNDLKHIDSACKVKKDFSEGRYLISFSANQKIIVKNIVRKHHSFIKHIHPVNYSGNLYNDLDRDAEILQSCVDKIGLSPDNKFSMQVINIENQEYTAKDIEVQLGQYIEKRYLIEAYFNDYDLPDDVNQQIINILIFRSNYFMGLGTARNNLCSVSDPYRIFSRWEMHICRSEFKLREALKVIDYHPIEAHTAIDLGASPGGWSYVLANKKMKVIAVDPAELDARVLKLKNVTHEKIRATNYSDSVKANLIVNDMNMESIDSANAVLGMSKNLETNGLLIMTIKLTHGPYDKRIKEAIKILSNQYKLIDVRCLFHNKQEVTAFFKKT